MIDGTIASVGRVSEPVCLTVEGGRLTAATGREGEALMELLTAHGPEGTTIAELGIGTNEKAELTGNVQSTDPTTKMEMAMMNRFLRP